MVPTFLISDNNKGDCVGYLMTVEGKKIYHAGDTEYIPEMRELGKVDVALLPFGGTFTTNIQEAAEAAIAIKRLSHNQTAFRYFYMLSTTYKHYGIHKKTPQPKLAISPNYS